jgi:hypothetical protein
VWWGAEPVDVYVGLDGCWVSGSGAEQGRAVAFADLARALRSVQQRVEAARRGRRLYRRARLRIWLSGGLARPFVVGPVAGLRRWHEAVALASAAAADATGLAEPCRVVLESWPGEQAALAVAAPAPTLQDIEQETQRLRLPVQSIRPWWCALLERSPSQLSAQALAIEDRDALTILRERAGQFVLARTYAPKPSADQVAPIIARTALAEGIEAGDIKLLSADPQTLLAPWPHAGGARA